MLLSSFPDTKKIFFELKKRGIFLFQNSDTIKLADDVRGEYSAIIKTANILPGETPIDQNALLSSPLSYLEKRQTLTSSCKFITTYFYESDFKNKSINIMFNFLTTLRHQLSKSWPKESNDYWNACRIHHYQCGGGFFSLHKDTYTAPINFDNEFPYLQVSFLLSKKGRDFYEGGFKFVERNGKTLYEDQDYYGAVLIFDGLCEHGVDFIDFNKKEAYLSDRGRICAMSNFYYTEAGLTKNTSS